MMRIAESSMVTDIPTAGPDQTIEDVERLMLKDIGKFETIKYVYVVEGRKLVGVVSVKELFRTPKSTRLSEIMSKKLVTVPPHSHENRAAIAAVRNGLKAIPVVDKDGKLLGVIPSDAIHGILHGAAVEDALRRVGISPKHGADVLLDASVWTHVRLRLPWLIIGVFGGLGAALIIDLFGATLRDEFVLASFIPLVVYLSDAVGTQTQTLFIRSMALDAQLSIRRYFLRELAIELILAAALGMTVALLSYLRWHSPVVGVVLAVSIFATTLVSTILSISIPWGFRRIGQDPAVATGPFATILSDILSIIVYCSVAVAVLEAI